MNTKENFTSVRIAGFKCVRGKGQTFFRDGKTPGVNAGVKGSHVAA